MRYEKVISIIWSMKRSWYVPSMNLFNENQFQRSSYQLSALDEIESYFRSSIKTPFREDPIEVLERFRKLFNDGSCDEKKTEDYRFLFNTYYEVVTDLIDHLII